ncbi:MAG: tripartite tricarboxylate transporter TctB family protein [Deltaproteobacteria bacterium]|nr:tripartite tricarboxylate transporter TctB family protein [Deltaproteobacteria bacterium]
MKNRDLFSSLFWMAFGVLFLVGALQQGLMRKGVPGPGFLPFISGIILISLSLMVLIPALRKQKKERGAWGREKFFTERDSLKKILLALMALFAFGFSLGYAGYLITTFLFILFIMRLMEPIIWRTVLITAFATVIFSYLLFVVLLDVQLPQGILGL